jgi:hypothetical protein
MTAVIDWIDNLIERTFFAAENAAYSPHRDGTTASPTLTRCAGRRPGGRSLSELIAFYVPDSR